MLEAEPMITFDILNMHRSTQNFNTQHTPPPPSLPFPGKAWAFELLKIGCFKFPLPRAKVVFKCPTLSSDISVIAY